MCGEKCTSDQGISEYTFKTYIYADFDEKIWDLKCVEQKSSWEYESLVLHVIFVA